MSADAELIERLMGLDAGDVLDEFDAQAILDAMARIEALSSALDEATRQWRNYEAAARDVLARAEAAESNLTQAVRQEREATKAYADLVAMEKLAGAKLAIAQEIELDELLAVLEPFADVDGEGDEDFPDGTAVVLKFGRSTVYTLTLGHFRAARAAIRSRSNIGEGK